MTQTRFVVGSKDLYERDVFWKRKNSEIDTNGLENVQRASIIINRRPYYVVECNLRSGYPEIVLKSVNFSKRLPKSDRLTFIVCYEIGVILPK